MKATTVLRWLVMLLLLVVITGNLLAEGVPTGDSAEYPPPPSERPTWRPLDPYPGPTSELTTWPTDNPKVPTRTSMPGDWRPPLKGNETEEEIAQLYADHYALSEPKKSNRPAPSEPTAVPTTYVPGPEDAARAKRQADLAESRLLSDEGWWK